MIPIVDTSVSYKINTPEGTAISLPVAGLWSRAAAWLIDLGIRSGIYILLAILFSLTGLFGQGLLLVSFFILEWFYPVFYEVLNHGMTPGKKIIGIRVVSDNGLHVDWSTSMTRNLLRFIDMLPVIYGVGFVSILLSKYSQRVGDIVAATYVIYHHEGEKISSSNFLSAPEVKAEFLSLIRHLKSAEKKAFVSYAERKDLLSDARKQELLNLLQPLFKEHHLQVTLENLEQFALAVADSNETI